MYSSKEKGNELKTLFSTKVVDVSVSGYVRGAFRKENSNSDIPPRAHIASFKISNYNDITQLEKVKLPNAAESAPVRSTSIVDFDVDGALASAGPPQVQEAGGASPPNASDV